RRTEDARGVSRRSPGLCRGSAAFRAHGRLLGSSSVRSKVQVAVEGFRRRPHGAGRSEEHTSELQSRENLVCRLLLEKKNNYTARRDRLVTSPMDEPSPRVRPPPAPPALPASARRLRPGPDLLGRDAAKTQFPPSTGI